MLQNLQKPLKLQSPARPLRIGIQTLGCRLNQYESDGIIQRFIESGLYQACPIEEGPDVAIINTCTVTEQADVRNQNTIRRILKKNPKCKVILTGCYAQTDPEKLKVPGAAFIIGNQYKSSLFEIVNGLEGKKGKEAFVALAAENKHGLLSLASSKLEHGYASRPVLHQPFAYGKVKPWGHTRAYLKIQDGCDKKCTYCKIPAARGRGVSRPYKEILEHVDYLQEQGIAEIILTGVNLGWYRDQDFQTKISFTALLEKILERLKSTRLRLSSIEPCDVDVPLAQLSLHPRFCDFLHVPLQSASAKILKAMRRSYSPYSFSKRIEKLKYYNPNIFLGTDIIVGFPGETEADFTETLNFCSQLEIAGIHGFRFSPRLGAPAAHFSGQVPLHTIKERMQRLQGLRLHLWQSYAQKQKGGLREGIIEKVNIAYKEAKELQEPKEDKRHEDHREHRHACVYGEALTDNYLRVVFPIPHQQKLKKGQKVKLHIGSKIEEEPYKLAGNLVNPA